MLHVNTTRPAIWTGLVLALCLQIQVTAQTPKTLDRPYDYVVLKGSDLTDWVGLFYSDVNPKFYRYDASTETWSPVPFQFDNLSHQGQSMQDWMIDEVDEFLFMAPDMGDQAPQVAWVDDNEAKQHNRLELHATDPLNPGEEGWIYLYQSSTLPLSNTAYLQYNTSADIVESEVYEIDHGTHGFQEHLKIKTSAGGDYVDFLDRQKFRLLIHAAAFGLDADIMLKEEMDETIEIETGVTAEIEVRKQSVAFTGDGIIRLQRNLTLYGQVKVKVGGIELYSLDGDFVFPTVYYPHFAEWQTPEIPLEPSEEYQIRGLRLSVDLNNNAKGMQFYNPFNPGGTLIDGNHDALDLTYNWPGLNWHMVVADPSNPMSSLSTATLLNVTRVIGDEIGDFHRLHYLDVDDYNANDTGDRRAIGDAGVTVGGNNLVGEFRADMALFYLARNLTTGEADIIANQHDTPVTIELNPQEPSYQLTLVLDPADGGIITADPDQEDYAQGSVVTLTASANPGYDFDHWSGDAAGNANPVDVIMDDHKTVTAHFVTLRQVTIQTDPSSVPFEVNGVTYTQPTTFNRLDGDTLSVCVDSLRGITFGARYHFRHWSDSGAVCHDYIVPHENDTLTAVFDREHQLITESDPESAGEILATPSADDNWYLNNAEISLEAVPVYGFAFDQWKGHLTGTDNPALLTMNTAKRVTALFEPDSQMVTVQTDPDTLPFVVDGDTYIGSETFKWQVGETHDLCVDSLFDVFDDLRLRFLEWDNPIARCDTFEVPDEDVTLTAQFREQYTLTKQVDPENSGEIVATPELSWYDADLQIELEAKPAFGYAFLNWADSLTGTANPAQILMNAPKTVTAQFGNQPPVVNAPDTSFAEDDTLRIAFILLMDWIRDENNPDSTLQVAATGGSQIGARLDTTAEQLLIYALTPDWNGTDTVTVHATDPLGQTGSGRMTITVTPEPDAPHAFDLLEPADQSVYSDWPDMIHFTWDEAFDPDTGDTLTYAMEIDTTDQFNSARGLMITDIRGNAYTLVWPSKWGDHTYFWRVTAIDEDSLVTLCGNGPFRFALATGVDVAADASVPKTFMLDQNYPNPFNGETFIRFGLPKDCPVRLFVYNMFGQRVRTLVDGPQTSGYHTVSWNGRDESNTRVASGIYLIRLETPAFRSVKKTILTQ